MRSCAPSEVAVTVSRYPGRDHRKRPRGTGLHRWSSARHAPFGIDPPTAIEGWRSAPAAATPRDPAPPSTGPAPELLPATRSWPPPAGYAGDQSAESRRRSRSPQRCRGCARPNPQRVATCRQRRARAASCVGGESRVRGAWVSALPRRGIRRPPPGTRPQARVKPSPSPTVWVGTGRRRGRGQLETGEALVGGEVLVGR